MLDVVKTGLVQDAGGAGAGVGLGAGADEGVGLGLGAGVELGGGVGVGVVVDTGSFVTFEFGVVVLEGVPVDAVVIVSTDFRVLSIFHASVAARLASTRMPTANNVAKRLIRV